MKRRAIQYSDKELAWIKVNKLKVRRQAHDEFVRKFDRPDVSLQNYVALCKRKGWMTGRTGRYDKGNIPWTKGRKGYHAPGSEKGWFKKGERRGAAVKLYKPIGTERLSKEGYVERKINDGMSLKSRWRTVHLIKWEATNGPIPEGHCLKCLDGNKANTDPSNWKCIPRGMLPRLNNQWGRQFDAAPSELKPTIMAVAQLEHKAKEVKTA